jgi:hypothetical protein
MMDADTKPKNAERLSDGPLDPTVRAARKAHRRMDDGEAFLPDPQAQGASYNAASAVSDGEVEAFGEEFIAAATAGEDIRPEANDEVSDDEDGGPFLVLDTNDDQPDAEGVASEPMDSVRSDFGSRTGTSTRSPARRFHP